MHHDIRDSCEEVIIRDGRQKFGIHNGESAAVQLCTETFLFPVLLICQDCIGRHFRTGCRDGQHTGNGQRVGNLDFLIPDIPECCVGMRSSVGNRLGGIDNAASAHTQNIICAEFHSLTDTFLCVGKRRIGLDTTESLCRKTCILNGFSHAVQQSALNSASAAVNYKYTAAAVCFDQASGLHFRALAENNSCGCILYKIIHVFTFAPDKYFVFCK